MDSKYLLGCFKVFIKDVRQKGASILQALMLKLISLHNRVYCDFYCNNMQTETAFKLAVKTIVTQNV
jgi:hypothetical protein